jgi:hypothetical protein
MRLRWLGIVVVACALAAVGCKSKDTSDGTCELPGSTDGCSDGQVCEMVGGETVCVAPVTIQGRIFDLGTEEGIEGARIVAMDANGAPRSGVTVSGAGGAYSLEIRIERDAEGNPVSGGELATLRVTAQGYQAYPKLPRPSIPLDLSAATWDEDEEEWVIQSSATDVGLIELEGDTSQLGIISGRVELAEGFEATVGGVLIVADNGGTASTGITDRGGEFVLFNVPAGSVDVTGFAAGLNVSVEMVDLVAGEEVTGVVLVASGEGLSAVTGMVEFAAIGDIPNVTSVILVAESTLEELLPGVDAFARGEAPFGLRAGDVTGLFRIEGVAPGRYAVLAAFENDGMTRDPDKGIGNTALIIIEVPGDGNDVDAGNFKVTRAIDIVEPGGAGMEIITEPPTFTFAKMPSVERYELRMFNALGELVYDPPAIDDPIGGGPVQHVYDGPALEDGMIYQFRVIAVTDTPTMDTYRNATEDLLGVFLYDPTPPE